MYNILHTVLCEKVSIQLTDESEVLQKREMKLLINRHTHS